MRKKKVDAKDGLATALELVLKRFNDCGVELTYADFNTCIPTFYVKVDKSKFGEKDTISDILKQVYAILWTLCYGKVTEVNKNCRIDLKYEEIP